MMGNQPRQRRTGLGVGKARRRFKTHRLMKTLQRATRGKKLGCHR